MPSDSGASGVFTDTHLSKDFLFTPREACSSAQEIVEKRRDVIRFLNRPMSEVIFESKIDHPPIAQVSMKFKGLQVELFQVRGQHHLLLFTKKLVLIPKTPRFNFPEPLVHFHKECALAIHQTPLIII